MAVIVYVALIVAASCAAFAVAQPCPPGTSAQWSGNTITSCAKCPAGRYNPNKAYHQNACTGICEAGFWCGEGSVDPRTHRCGGPAVYCPTGSSTPIPVSPGHYTVGGPDADLTRTHQVLCEPGHWCDGGVRYECGAGHYGSSFGATNSSCDGLCPEGYYCPIRSTSPRAHKCGGVGVFCPLGSSEPQSVFSEAGYYTIGTGLYGDDFTTQRREVICERGHWCVNGSRFECPAGKYGDALGLSDADCNGNCTSGFYCPRASTRSTMIECGGPQLFCPEGSALPTRVSSGHFTISLYDTVDEKVERLTTRSSELPCPAGHYCEQGSVIPCPAGRYNDINASAGPAHLACDLCDEGHFCPPGSSTPRHSECGGAGVYCPRGSGSSIDVSVDVETDYDRDGVVTVADKAGRIRALYPEERTEPYDQLGWYTRASARSKDGPTHLISTLSECHFEHSNCSVVPHDALHWTLPTVVGAPSTRDERVLCEPGHWCSEGERFECAPGRYGASPGLRTSHCTGECDAGFFCPAASKSPRQLPCSSEGNGAGHDSPTAVYCPPAQGSPTPVDDGYYTSRYPRAKLAEEPPGPYLWSKPTRTPALPEWLYRANERRYAALGVDGLAPYFAVPRLHGTQLFFYAPERDHTTPPYSGHGFWSPDEPFTLAYTEYGDGPQANARIKDKQFLCEPGHWCHDGLKYPCAAGRYGGVTGLTTKVCSGLCDAGYYCPLGSTRKDELECGGTHVYCPTGSALPTPVSRGFYTIGGEAMASLALRSLARQKVGVAENTTRTAEIICEEGHYCEGGRKMQCPAGRYGAERGLADGGCSGPCMHGHFCPPGSVNSTQMECAAVFGLTRFDNTFWEQSADTPGYDTTCMAHMLPVWATQFVEFALLSASPFDTTRWDLTKQSPGGFVNRMRWNESQLAFEALGTGGRSMIGSRWRPGAGDKTFCFWKKFVTADLRGVDGYWKVFNENDYFMMGTYWSYRDRVYVAAGQADGTYASVLSQINRGDWVFYCLTSGGAGSTAEAYVATPLDTMDRPRLVWEANIAQDIGVLKTGNELGMVYGAPSTFDSDEIGRDTRQAYSNALYGGFIHWDHHLTEDEIYEVYKVTKRFYPGHGGIRSPDEIECGHYDSNEWEQGYKGRHEGPRHAKHLEKVGASRFQDTGVAAGNADGNMRLVDTAPGDEQRSVGIGSIPWENYYRDKHV